MSKRQKIFANLVIIGVVLLGLLIPHFVLAAGETIDPFEATYMVTFENNWANSTHPHPDGNFPGNAHWSPLIGGAHNANATFWEPGGIATDGIEQMAETGATGILTNEVNDEITAGNALAVLSGPGIPAPMGIGDTATINSFTVNKDFPLVTLVSMVAPSPDWFTGVHSEALLDENGHWVDSKVITLYPYDAGTDNGTDYTSANSDTNPRIPISSLQDVAPFSSEPVGTFTFTRINYTDIHINKQVEPTSNVTSQGQVTYTVVLSNSGDMDATSTVLTDTLPADTIFAHWIEQPGGANGSGNMITWTGNVTQTDNVTFTYVATYTGAAYGQTLTNVAEFSHASGNRGQASADFAVQPGPVLALSKSGPSVAKLNEPITYTLTLMNNGPTPATNLVISDTLPVGANFVSASNSGTLTGDAVEWQPGDLSGNSTIQVSFVVTAAITSTLVNHDYGARADGDLTVSGSNSVSTFVDSSGLNRVYLPVVIK